MNQSFIELRVMAVELISSQDKTRQAIGGEIKRLADSAESALAAMTAERDAFAAENEAVHRVIVEMCGLPDESTVYAVQAVIDQRDALAEQLKAMRAHTVALGMPWLDQALNEGDGVYRP